mgnify:FL=1
MFSTTLRLFGFTEDIASRPNFEKSNNVLTASDNVDTSINGNSMGPIDPSNGHLLDTFSNATLDVSIVNEFHDIGNCCSVSFT